MLEVHPPEHPVHGVRDFFLHLFTITVGLLIALGLENTVEWRHHVHLKHQAEETMRQELQSNKKELAEVVGAIPREQEAFQQIEGFLQARVDGRTPPLHSLRTGIMQVTPQNAAWQTAAATGALSFMEYDEVQKFSSAYQLQSKLERFEDDAVPPLVRLIAAIGYSPDPAKMPPAQAAESLKDVHMAMAHLTALSSLAADVNKAYDEALKQ